MSSKASCLAWDVGGRSISETSLQLAAANDVIYFSYLAAITAPSVFGVKSRSTTKRILSTIHMLSEVHHGPIGKHCQPFGTTLRFKKRGNA